MYERSVSACVSVLRALHTSCISVGKKHVSLELPTIKMVDSVCEYIWINSNKQQESNPCTKTDNA